MAGGPAALLGVSLSTNGRVYPGDYVGQTNARQFQTMHKIEASLGADTHVYLLHQFPEVLPSGTCTLRLIAMANATSGNMTLTPSWASVAAEENMDTITLNSETGQTLTWSSGDSDVQKVLEVTMDADTPVASELCLVDLLFTTASYTLAAEAAVWVEVVWV